MEQALERMGFPSLDILQPGPLLGWRRNACGRSSCWRAAVMPLVNPFMSGYAQWLIGASSARTVAAAMLGASRSGRRGVYRYTWPSLRAARGAEAGSAPALETGERDRRALSRPAIGAS